jgi:hypothetical protein
MARNIRPPSGLQNHVSRREAAALLGFSSEFKIRQLEKQGRVQAIRGAMNQAWYSRAEILGLRRDSGTSARPVAGGSPGKPAAQRWSDSALIAYLRGDPAWPGPPHGRVLPPQQIPRFGQEPLAPGAAPRPVGPTVVDLVADTGVSIARAQRIYRFWLAHDLHPSATALRSGRRRMDARPRLAGTDANAVTISIAAGETRGDPAAPGEDPHRDPGVSPTRAAKTNPISGVGQVPPIVDERRGGERIERDGLIQQLRHADPAVRARAFEKLKKRPG